MTLIKKFAANNFYQFFEKLKFNYPYKDHSHVVLYTDLNLFPEYLQRKLLSSSSETGRHPIRVTLISTTRNEAKSAEKWMQSLSNQTRLPDEVVIVDGGSTDGTVEIIKANAAKLPIPLIVIDRPGARIARGRNIAIQAAKYPIVACSDFGSFLDSHWLQNLVAPFEIDASVDVSEGFYEGIVEDELDRVHAQFFVPDLANINPSDFLPSSRSLAMKKTFWEKAGYYPEWLSDAGEDSLFDIQAKSVPSNWAFVPEAKVYWQVPRTIKQLYKTSLRYSKGDGESGLFANNYHRLALKTIQSFSLKLLYLLLVILAFLKLPLVGWVLLCLAAIPGYRVLRGIQNAGRVLNVNISLAFYNYWLNSFLNMVRLVGYFKGVQHRPENNPMA